jgi:hypothetical protein
MYIQDRLCNMTKLYHKKKAKNKEIKWHPRIKCPLCGLWTYPHCLEREQPLNEAYIMTSQGYQGIQYHLIDEPIFLSRLKELLITRIERLYERLTGTNIQQLKELAYQTVSRTRTIPLIPKITLTSIKIPMNVIK